MLGAKTRIPFTGRSLDKVLGLHGLSPEVFADSTPAIQQFFKEIE